jgi:hypothetical protein
MPGYHLISVRIGVLFALIVSLYHLYSSSSVRLRPLPHSQLNGFLLDESSMGKLADLLAKNPPLKVF